MGNEAKLTTIMIVNDYVEWHYIWNNQEQKALGYPKEMAEVIIKRLQEKKSVIESAYVIEHDPEQYKYFDDTLFDIFSDRKHFHLIIRFSNEGKQYTKNELAEYVGIKERYLAKGRPGGYTWDNMCSYLTHIKYEDKIQYHPSSVITLIGDDYQEIFRDNQRRWLSGRNAVNKKNKNSPTKKQLNKLLKEALALMDNYEADASKLSREKKYTVLFKEDYYANKIMKKQKRLDNLFEMNKVFLISEICNGNIKSVEELKRNKLLYAVYMKNKEWLPELPDM